MVKLNAPVARGLSRAVGIADTDRGAEGPRYVRHQFTKKEMVAVQGLEPRTLRI